MERVLCKLGVTLGLMTLKHNAIQVLHILQMAGLNRVTTIRGHV